MPGGQGDFQQLGQALGNFERMCLGVKERVTEMRRRKVNPAEKQDLDAQIKELKEAETRLKSQVCAPALLAISSPTFKLGPS